MALVHLGQSTPLEDEMAEEEELREKYDFEINETVNDFADEPPIRHDVYPESDDEDEAEADGHHKSNLEGNIWQGSGNIFKGQQFFTATAFKECVLDHALKEGRNIKQYRWDTRKCGFECVGGNCNWRVYCSMKKGSSMWEIHGYKFEHSCVPNGECDMLKVPIIARLFVDKIRQEPEFFYIHED